MEIEKLRCYWDDHSSVVYAYLLKLTRSESDARDFLQEVFCRLARQPELLGRLVGDPRGYLLRLARNAVVDQVRRNQVRDRVLGSIEAERRGEAANAEDPDTALVRSSLERALAQLPAEQREVVHERLWRRRTLDEIAREKGISINTAASRFRYGLDKMRELLRALYEDLSPGTFPNSKTTMPQNSETPFNDPRAEEPIIQPLEQRRVPSATGAAFALPALPIDEDGGDELPADIGDAELAIDPADELIPVDPEITFDDVIENLDDPSVDGEVDPNWIFQTIFIAEEGEGGEVIDDGSIDDGEGDFEDGSEGEIVGDTGDGDSTDDGEVTLSKDGHVIEPYYRGGGMVTTTSVGGGSGIYTLSGAGGSGAEQVADNQAAESGVPTAETDTGHHDAPAPVAAPAQVETTTVSVDLGHLDVQIEDDFAAAHTTMEHNEIIETPVHFAAAGEDTVVSHASLDLPVAHDFGAEPQHADAETAELTTVDQWVPVHETTDGTASDTHEIVLPVAEHVDLATDPVVSGAPVQPSALRDSMLAMAATGALLTARDTKTRESSQRD